MDHESNDLLLSAYLDGELNADERAHVEQLLATSAEARQLVEELKAIRAGLQSLPKHRLEPDFAQQVLRRIEQEKKTDPAKAAQHDPLPASVFRSRRGIAWSAIAIAAAVIIMVATRHDEQADRQLARGGAANVQNAPQETVARRASEDKVAQKLAAGRREQPMQPSIAAPLSVAKDEQTPSLEKNNRNDFSASGSFDGSGSVAAAPQPQAAEAIEQRAPQKPGNAEPVLVVQVGLKHQPGAEKEFEHVLAKNRIALEVDQDKIRDEETRKQDLGTLNSPPSGGVDAVYVETTPEQLTAVLQELTKSKSILSLSTNLSPPLPSSDKQLAPSSRARRSDALHAWVAQNLDNLPQTIELSVKSSSSGGSISSLDKMQPKSEGNFASAVGAPASPRAAAAAPPVAAQLYRTKSLPAESLAADKANPPPSARAVFILRSVDSAGSTNPAASTEPAAGAVPAEQSSPAAEKQ